MTRGGIFRQIKTRSDNVRKFDRNRLPPIYGARQSPFNVVMQSLRCRQTTRQTNDGPNQRRKSMLLAAHRNKKEIAERVRNSTETRRNAL
jgi:hypothetical protein